MSTLTLRTFVCSVLILYVSIASAQFNIKVGYNGNYTNLNTTNEIFNLYNTDMNPAEKKLKPIRFYHGIEIGGRYKIGEYFGLDFGIATASGKNSAKGLSIPNSEAIDNQIKIQLTNYYLGLENYFGRYGYGATLGYQKIKYKNRLSTSSENLDILSQKALNSRFYLIFEVPSHMTSFSFRPFVSLNWEPYDLAKLDDALLINSELPTSNYEENAVIFGLSILIYNGPQ